MFYVWLWRGSAGCLSVANSQVYKMQYIAASPRLTRVEQVEVAPGQFAQRMVQDPKMFDSFDAMSTWLKRYMAEYPGDQLQIIYAPVLDAEIEIGYESIEE